MMRPLLYVCAPYKTATPEEVRARDAAINDAIACRWTPIFVPYAFERFLSDDESLEREIGLEFSLEILRRCNELLIVGKRITAGMEAEIAEWSRLRQFCVAARLPVPPKPRRSPDTGRGIR